MKSDEKRHTLRRKQNREHQQRIRVQERFLRTVTGATSSTDVSPIHQGSLDHLKDEEVKPRPGTKIEYDEAMETFVPLNDNMAMELLREFSNRYESSK